jgi:hypothetical protein
MQAIRTMLASLQACAPSPSSVDRVTAAYETSGVIAVPAYTRSIFSSSNF